MHLCSKIAKRNNNYKLAQKGNEVPLKNSVKKLNFERSQNSTKRDPNVGKDPCICVVNLLSVIMTTSQCKREKNLLNKPRKTV